jgi:hypothetical protein
MQNSIFNYAGYQNLLKEYDTIAKVNTRRGDKLAVNQSGVLEISQGGFLQAPIRTIKNLFSGGYNRDDVTSHLEKIGTSTQAFIKKVKQDPDYLNSLENVQQLRLLEKKIRQVATAVSEMEFAYREIKAFPASKDKTCEKLSLLYESFSTVRKSLEEDLKAIKKIYKKEPQKKPIDFKAPIDLKKIKLYMPSSQTPQDVLKLAENAESQIVPLWKKVGAIALAVIGITAAALPLSCLNTIKYVFWNPIELLIKGKIVTRSPFEWGISETMNKLPLSEDPEFALERYAGQLLWAPIITKDTLLKPGKSTNYISPSGLCKVIDAVGKTSRCREIDIPHGANRIKGVEELLKKYGFKSNPDSAWQYKR